MAVKDEKPECSTGFQRRLQRLVLLSSVQGFQCTVLGSESVLVESTPASRVPCTAGIVRVWAKDGAQ